MWKGKVEIYLVNSLGEVDSKLILIFLLSLTVNRELMRTNRVYEEKKANLFFAPEPFAAPKEALSSVSLRVSSSSSSSFEYLGKSECEVG